MLKVECVDFEVVKDLSNREDLVFNSLMFLEDHDMSVKVEELLENIKEVHNEDMTEQELQEIIQKLEDLNYIKEKV